MKKILISFLVFSVSGSFVFAQTADMVGPNTTEGAAPQKSVAPMMPKLPVIKIEQERAREEIKNIREAGRTDIQGIRDAAKMQNDAARDAFKVEREALLKQIQGNPQEAMKILQERKDVLQKDIDARKDSLKTTIEAKRAEMEKVISAKKDELKTKINQFKDEKKKEVVGKVSENLNVVNKNAVNRFTNNINEFDKAVLNITTRAEKAAANNKDVSAVFVKITAAKSLIEAARVAIAAQAGKMYSVSITTEVKVADDLKKSREQLNADLKVVQDKIKAAHEGVWAALTELQKVPEINKVVAPTPAAQPVTQ